MGWNSKTLHSYWEAALLVSKIPPSSHRQENLIWETEQTCDKEDKGKALHFLGKSTVSLPHPIPLTPRNTALGNTWKLFVHVFSMEICSVHGMPEGQTFHINRPFPDLNKRLNGFKGVFWIATLVAKHSTFNKDSDFYWRKELKKSLCIFYVLVFNLYGFELL